MEALVGFSLLLTFLSLGFGIFMIVIQIQNWLNLRRITKILKKIAEAKGVACD